jgi:serine/threonine-protein kinase
MSGGGPRTIGNFAIERELGSGGMGVVLLGRHQSLDRPAVLKRLRPELSASEELVERFAREARAAAAIHHPNVVAVYDWIGWRGEHYIAQEYVDGVDLRAALAQAQRFPWRIAALVALELARGLEAIHARGMVHRDLKPANVLLGRNGDVKIADFGIALDPTSDGLTRPGTAVGSPPYIAPEQLLGERMDARGDLFGLGVVLYELLTGAPPYRVPAEGETDSLLSRIQRERYEPVRRVTRDAPRWLVRLVRALVRAKPRSRPASAQRVRRLLEARLRAFPAEAKLEVASWLWEEGVFKPREGDTVVVSAPSSRLRRLRWGRALAYAAAAVCALAIGSFVGVPGLPLRELAARARGLAAERSGASAPARVHFATDQRLRVRIDGGEPVAVEPGEERELAPGQHQLVFEWPSGARDSVALQLGAGEARSIRPALPPPAE